ncbi:MAG: hypothetical protein WAW37_11805 [Syntrophobacteraceae bacterium]
MSVFIPQNPAQFKTDCIITFLENSLSRHDFEMFFCDANSGQHTSTFRVGILDVISHFLGGFAGVGKK